MSNPTATRKARDFRDELVRNGVVSIFYEGLMGDSVWISSNRRAYRLKDLSRGHLMNIVLKYHRNKEELPECISREQERREEAKLEAICESQQGEVTA